VKLQKCWFKQVARSNVQRDLYFEADPASPVRFALISPRKNRVAISS